MFGIFDFTKPIVDFSNFEFSQLGEALLFGGAITLIGMLTVFAVLSLLWLCLIGFKFVFKKIEENRASKKAASTVANTVDSDDKLNEATEGEIVAVIAAAIAMAESENSGLKFKVVSFRRV